MTYAELVLLERIESVTDKYRIGESGWKSEDMRRINYLVAELYNGVIIRREEKERSGDDV